MEMATEAGTATAIQTREFIPSEVARTWHFNFSVINNPIRLNESFALRYEVYCKERQFLAPENYPTKSEMDPYDVEAIHVAGTNQDGLMVGTVRLVLPSSLGFPLFEHCELFPEFKHLADRTTQQTTAEISRLAISRLYRRRQNDGFYGFDAQTDFDKADKESCALSPIPDQTPHRRTKPEIVLGLYKAMYQASKRQGITHWFAAMEKSLLRLLRRYNIGFTAIGPELDYYGPVVPYIAAITDIEEAVFKNCPEMFAEFITGLESDLIPAYAKKIA